MRIVDLSLTITPEMPGVEIAPAKRLETDGWNAATLALYSHCGTHMDAPRHFLPAGATIEQTPLEKTIGLARVVNLAPVEPRQLHTVAAFAEHEAEIAPGSRLLLRTDWSKRYGTPEYRNSLPRISIELAEWLVQKQVALIGVEPPSVADVNNLAEVREVHEILLSGGVTIVEGLTNLDQLRQSVVQFLAIPLKWSQGDGSPVRAIAIEEDSHE